MALETWVALAGAVLAMAVVPGPSAVLMASQSAMFGVGRALVALMGDLTACVLLVVLVGAGVGQLLTVWPTATAVLRLAGIGYLVVLAVRYLTAVARSEPRSAPPAKALFGQGFCTCASNPKLLLHLGAFLPQFLDPMRPIAQQLVLIAATQMLIDAMVLGAYAVAGRRLVMVNPRLVQRLAAIAMLSVAAAMIAS